MRLYLVRHGDANSAAVDPARGLSERGQVEIARLASFLEPLGLAPAAVWHSGKARAAQTAAILAGALSGSPPVDAHPGLLPNDPAGAMAAEVETFGDDLMLVGHLPFMAILSGLLLGQDGPPEFLAFRTGTMTCLCKESSAPWYLEWMIHPGITLPRG